MVITGAQTQAEVAEAAVTRMLASVGDRSVAELLQDLETSKAIESKLAVYQVRAAATLAALERHGDGGAGVLRHATGVSRRQAESRARTARILEEMPAAREALESGRVSFANAARLAQAAEGVEAGAVEADASLLAKAESMTDDQFAREARRWTASHQADGGEADYRRCRERRSLRMWDGDDGMTHMKGEFDPVTGERIRNRLEAEARRLRRADGAGSGGGGGGAGGGDKRGFGQAMADALDGLTDVGSGVGRIAGGAAGRGDPAGGSDGTGSPAGNNSTGGSDHSSTDSNVDGRTGSGAGDSDHGSAGNNSTGGSDHSSTDSNVDGRTGSGAGDSDHGSAGNNSTGRTSGGTKYCGRRSRNPRPSQPGQRRPRRQAGNEQRWRPSQNQRHRRRLGHTRRHHQQQQRPERPAERQRRERGLHDQGQNDGQLGRRLQLRSPAARWPADCGHRCGVPRRLRHR